MSPARSPPLTRPGAVSFITLLFCADHHWFWLRRIISAHHPPKGPHRQRLKTIRRRRYAYLSGIAIGIALLIFATNWPPKLNTPLHHPASLLGIGLAILQMGSSTRKATKPSLSFFAAFSLLR